MLISDYGDNERDETMGNQQERSLAWLAGILDGEGTVSIQVYTLPDGRIRITPFVAIVNTDEGILQGCREILEEIGVAYRNCKAPSSGHGFQGKLVCSNLRIDGQKPVKKLLEVIGEYLRSKKRQNAATVLRYLQSREVNGFSRDEKGRVRRSEYTRSEIEMIASVRCHPRAKSSEAICQAPNVVDDSVKIWSDLTGDRERQAEQETTCPDLDVEIV